MLHRLIFIQIMDEKSDNNEEILPQTKDVDQSDVGAEETAISTTEKDIKMLETGDEVETSKEDPISVPGIEDNREKQNEKLLSPSLSFDESFSTSEDDSEDFLSDSEILEVDEFLKNEKDEEEENQEKSSSDKEDQPEFQGNGKSLQESRRKLKKPLVSRQTSFMYSPPQRGLKRRNQLTSTQNASAKASDVSISKKVKVGLPNDDLSNEEVEIVPEPDIDPLMVPVPSPVIPPPSLTTPIPTILQASMDNRFERFGTTLKKIKTTSLEKITKIFPEASMLSPPRKQSQMSHNLIDFFAKRQDKSMKIVKVNPNSPSPTKISQQVIQTTTQVEKNVEEPEKAEQLATPEISLPEPPMSMFRSILMKNLGTSTNTNDLNTLQPTTSTDPLASAEGQGCLRPSQVLAAKLLNNKPKVISTTVKPDFAKITPLKRLSRVSLEKNPDGSYHIVRSDQDQKSKPSEAPPKTIIIPGKNQNIEKKLLPVVVTRTQDDITNQPRLINNSRFNRRMSVMTVAELKKSREGASHTSQPPPLVAIARPQNQTFAIRVDPSSKLQSKVVKEVIQTALRQSKEISNSNPSTSSESFAFFNPNNKVQAIRDEAGEPSADGTNIQVTEPTAPNAEQGYQREFLKVFMPLQAEFPPRVERPEIVKYTIPQGMLYSDSSKICTHKVKHVVSKSTDSSLASSVADSSEMFVIEPDPEIHANISAAASAIPRNRRKSVLAPKKADDEMTFEEGPFQVPPRPQVNIDLIENLAKYRVYLKTLLNKVDIPNLDLNEDGDEYINLYKIFRS